MIEAYVLATLVGLGYVMNKHREQAVARPADAAADVDPADLPSGNAYHSTRLDQVRRQELAAATASYQKSVSPDPVQARVVNRQHGLFVRSGLTGTDIPREQFTHNNMVPFYRGSLKQAGAGDGGRAAALLESYGSAGPTAYKPKTESDTPLFLPQERVANINGMPSVTDFLESRYVAPTLRNNVLPFEQVRVGPGLGQGYTAAPTGGFQQQDLEDLIRPKTVDELRVASNPKVTYEGRVVEGSRPTKRAEPAPMSKNRTETFWEQGPERLLKTTGAVLKETLQPDFDAKPTHRQDTSTDYQGGAFNAGVGYDTSRDARVQDPHRAALEAFSVAAPSAANRQVNDYGKAAILVYSNERDTTTANTYQGSLATVVKAMVAPLQDMLKANRKEYGVEHPRQFGALSVQVPDKVTVRDPNDVLRTTIKETTLHDSAAGAANLRGPAHKPTVHDPSAVARTTVKETTLHDDAAGAVNLRGPAHKPTVHDPNAVARTTLKETTLHDAPHANLATGERRGAVYDPEEVARTTIRQTTAAVDGVRNLDGVKRETAAPDDAARTTLKQTTLAAREGNVDGLAQRNQGYLNENFHMKPTQMEEYVDYERLGGAKVGQGGEGYTVASVEAKETQKEELHGEYYGVGGDTRAKQATSHEDIYNARFDDLKEVVAMAGRAPTASSVKVAAGVESVHARPSGRLEQENGRLEAPRVAVPAAPEACVSGTANVTRARQAYAAQDRLDPALLDAYLENPYTKPLNSVR